MVIGFAEAAEVVERWLATGRPGRETIAAAPDLRALPAPQRGAVVRLANAAVAAQRRFGFLLGGCAGLSLLPAPRHARALVLGALVDRGELPPEAAARLWRERSGPALDFGAVLDPAARLLAIADPVARFGVEHSLPDWLAARFLGEFGTEAAGLAAALLQPAPRTIRANPLRCAGRDGLAEALAAEGITARPTRFSPFGLVVDGDSDLFATRAYAAGTFEQQDEASQLAALAVAPPPRGMVLDLCAGTGGKTLALAAILRNRGAILATDVHEGRLEALRRRARAAGAGNVRALTVPEGDWPGPVGSFAAAADRLLVDAPCSGTGSLRRRPEARWRLAEADLGALRATQDALLDRAAAALRPGARLVYATCSLFADENERAVEALLDRCPGLELVRLAEVLGGAVARPIADPTGTFLSLRPDRHGTDGFFLAILRRRAAR